MRNAVLALALVVAASAAQAQPITPPCAVCYRGDAVIAHFDLESIRPLAADIAALPLGDPLTPDQYARLLAMRQRTPALLRLGALDDKDLSAVAASLCGAAAGTCTDATVHSLRCLADRCTVALPAPDPRTKDLETLPATCHQFSKPKRSPSFGLGLDWGTGVQRSAYPTDGRAWSFGLAARLRQSNHLGFTARVDRIAGRDEATDTDGNGIDDRSTGSITRLSFLAGPSLTFANTRFEGTTRYLRLDLLGGYLSTRSQPGEDGLAAGADLTFRLAVIELGMRVVQGFGDAQDATLLLAHVGFGAGSSPQYRDRADCSSDESSRASRFALGIDIPLGGYGISHENGYLATGLGFEGIWHLTHRLDAVTRGDILVFPGDEIDRVIHQALLAGLRIDHKQKKAIGWFTTVLGGYTHGAGLTPSSAGTGPVIDLGVGWGGQGKEGAGNLRLHGRFGLGDNTDYRVIFLSMSAELRFDPRRWRDRD